MQYWLGGLSSEACKLFAAQRKAVRLLAHLGYRDDCRQAFVNLKIFTLPSLYILENLLFVKNNSNFQSHEKTHYYNTSNKANLVPLYCRLTRCLDGPGHWAVKFYNTLPQSIRDLHIKMFYNTVKQILIQNAFYLFDEFLNFRF